MKVFIPHYTKLIERRQHVLPILSAFDVYIEERYDKEEIDPVISEYYMPSPDLWADRINLWKQTDIPKGLEYYTAHNYRPLRAAEISLAIKHILIWELICAQTDDICLVAEDDITNTGDLYADIQGLLSLGVEFDVIFLGSAGVSCSVKETIGNLVRVGAPGSRCTDAYLVTKKAAKRMLDVVKPFVLPIDFEMSYLFYKLYFNVFHLVNPFVFQDPQFVSVIQY